MDAPDLSIENFSFSRLATRNIRQIYAHKLQGFRWVLGFATIFHLSPNFGKLYWHYFTHHTPSIFPDFLAFCLSMAARFTWLFLFRDPAEFLHFKRPGRAYRGAVCGTVALTTLPNGVVHIWALKMALKNDTVVLSGVWSSILAIIFLVPLAGLVYWMAWRFLLGLEESDEEFEPTVKNGMFITPYTDNPSVLFTRSEATTGYLSQAYEEQKLREQEPPSGRISTGPEDVPLSEEAQVRSVEEPDPQSIEAIAATTIDVARPPRCQTIARFEHMSESYSGPHSWFSFPIISLILSGCATVLLIGLLVWIHEDREYKLRDPSPTVKKSLNMPLGMCLLAFYAFKHRVRASIFEHFNMQPPQPWKKMLSILPSWVGTGGTFKNQNTGEITVYDPGRRAFPWRAYHQPALIRSREYIAAFNANVGECTTYWGHSGRSMKTDFRLRATIHRLGFLFLAIYLTGKGFWNILWYDVPNVYEEMLKYPNTITKEDVARISRILIYWQVFLFSSFWFTIFAFVFGLGCMGSMLVLFMRTVWKYVPQEEKDKIARDQREREQRSAGGGSLLSDGTSV